jgi:AcrR family transcriptional regulator
MDSPRPERLRPPRQARSRATLERLFQATAELLTARRFEEATVADLARQAGSSVGAFYTRFADKQALIEAFDERMFEEGRLRWEALLEPKRWRDAATADILHAVVERLVESRRRHTGLLRSLALYARSQPARRFRARAARLNRQVAGQLRAIVLRPGEPLNHPDPGRAVDLGLLMVDAAVREAILFEAAGLNPRKVSDRTLVRELTLAWCRYLGIPDARDPRPRSARGGGKAMDR